jgi:hypothetical protein
MTWARSLELKWSNLDYHVGKGHDNAAIYHSEFIANGVHSEAQRRWPVQMRMEVLD